jgi:hypothetical protein
MAEPTDPSVMITSRSSQSASYVRPLKFGKQCRQGASPLLMATPT